MEVCDRFNIKVTVLTLQTVDIKAYVKRWPCKQWGGSR